CNEAKMDRFIDAFVKAEVAAVCLHPRPGLLKPYGGDAWFALIRRTVERCAARGLDVWLYDEDPWPSGNAGGWVTLEHPEFRAMQIQRYEPNTSEPGAVAAATPTATGQVAAATAPSHDASSGDKRPGLYCCPAGIPL